MHYVYLLTHSKVTTYKDGTEPGTCDCRWFAGIYFLGRTLVLYIIYGVVRNVICYTLAGFSLMIIGMLIILLQQFKSSKVNKYHTLLPFLRQFVAFLSHCLIKWEAKLVE